MLDFTLDWYSDSNGHYTKIIGNPPYGAWQDYEKRKILKKKYGGHVRETYTLFITRAIDLLKNSGKLVFIIPDTFLALHLHKDTRKKILENTQVEELLLIPSKFFPGVNFGYSNLCIMTLKKSKPSKNHKVKIVYVKSNIDNLYQITDSHYIESDNYEEIEQGKILNSIDHSFFIGGEDKIRTLITSCEIKLGDIAKCVTGFCSGENTKFYRPLEKAVKNSKNYNIARKEDIEMNFLKEPDLINGLRNNKKYIPILKGGSGSFVKQTEWCVLWDNETVNFYRTNKKSRFQNSKFYFREGIGIPMVKSSKSTAFLLNNRLFDQSIVGIFPENKGHLYYLLGLLNSEVCNLFLKTINHTANNSANYLKKIPVIIDEDQFYNVTKIVKKLILNPASSEEALHLNKIFNNIYSI